jgi:uncharacterized membrane protein HdeD (DUF308 family)
MKKTVKRFVNRKQRNKWLYAGFGGLLSGATSLVPLLEGHVSPVPFAILTAAAFVVAGIAHLIEPDDGN